MIHVRWECTPEVPLRKATRLGRPRYRSHAPDCLSWGGRFIALGSQCFGRVGRLPVTGRVIPTIMAGAALSSCAIQGTSAWQEPVWLDFADSQIVRADDVSRYRCTEGLLVAERISSGKRKVTCGSDAVPALLR
jgi:hypothetical protein